MKQALPLRAFISSLFNWQGMGRLTRVRRYIFLAFFFLTYVVGSIYRAYAWGHGLQDLGLADAWSNIWAVPTFTFGYVGFIGSEEEQTAPMIAGSAIGFIVYEFLQITGFVGLVFDLEGHTRHPSRRPGGSGSTPIRGAPVFRVCPGAATLDPSCG